MIIKILEPKGRHRPPEWAAVGGPIGARRRVD